MNTNKLLLLFTLFYLLPLSNRQLQSERIDREPAAAGSFYPDKRDKLNITLEQLFTKAVPPKNIKNVIAIISPHAGYVYSGEVAASAFNQIDTAKEYKNIFILATSHHLTFNGASIYSQGNFITPLGKVRVNTYLAHQLIKKYSFFSNRMDAHAKEHSLEVQLPFLQYRLKRDFKIVPIVLGTQSPETCQQIADALQPYLNLDNLFIISTDFSHYPPYSDAKNIDKATADAILTNSSENLLRSMTNYQKKDITNLATCLCGWTSVLTLLYMTEDNQDASYTCIQYKNSGDTENGDKNQVVGYNAMTISLHAKEERISFKLTDKDKKDLLAIAANTIEQYVKTRKKPEIEEKYLSSELRKHYGAFVTLKKQGNLRGCIGQFEASEPLYTVVQKMAISSAMRDYRFSPVDPSEIPELEIEISVLTPMRRIRSIDEIELGKHGIYIRKGNNSGTFLPQVATETGWTKEEFLGHCAQDKAGIGWDGWKDAIVYVYEALVFSEKDLKGK